MPQFARLLACAARAIKQQLVRVAQQAHADGQPFGVAQLFPDQAESAYVVADFGHIIGIADLETRFLIEQVGQRGLSCPQSAR